MGTKILVELSIDMYILALVSRSSALGLKVRFFIQAMWSGQYLELKYCFRFKSSFVAEGMGSYDDSFW